MAECERPRMPSQSLEKDSRFPFKTFDIDGTPVSLPSAWEQQGEGFRNFKAKPDDVWIMTQPRSGTTLTQELVWLLANNLDFENAKKFELMHRSPELTASLFTAMWNMCKLLRPSRDDPKVLESTPVDTSKYSYEVYADAMSPRILKTHLTMATHKNILDSGCKIVYVVRNPKDVIVSKARFLTFGPDAILKMTKEEFIRGYISTENPPWGSYWDHVKQAWNLRHRPNVLFLHYEEMRIDLPAAIKKVAKFLGKTYSDEEIAAVAAHLDIDSFRKNPMVNELLGFEKITPTFIGKGRVGGWHELLTPELEAEIDRWMEKNNDFGIKFHTLKK